MPRSLVRLAALALTAAAALAPGSAGADDAGAHPVDRAEALLARVVPHVESACGRTFPAPPRVVRLSARDAEQAFREDLREEVARRHPDATDGQRAALLLASARTSVASCVARYSFHSKAIVLVRPSFDAQRAAAGFAADDAEDLLVAVLAHEAVHALDDAHHDLQAFYAGAPDAEALRARAMVAEGRAVVFGRRAAAAAGAAERARALLPGGDAPRDLHAWLLRLTYEGGARFVTAQDERGAREQSESVFERPPGSTCAVFHPERWPDGADDPRPARRLAAAQLDAPTTALSELQLRARYAALHGPATAERLFAGFRGGAQALVDSTNVAVLAFSDADAARRYAEVAADEAPTEREGDLVLRAFGPAAEELLARLRSPPKVPHTK